MSQPAMPAEFEGKVVALIGRFGVLPRRAVAGEIARRGGVCRRALTRRSELMVVGERAVQQLTSGRLRETIASADQQGAACISESSLLRALGLIRQVAPEPAALSIDELPAKVRLAPEIVRLLVLFDLIEPQEGGIGFRDLVTAREIARLLHEGVELAHILQSIGELGRRPGPASHPLARHKLVSDPSGHLLLRLGEGLAELDGQMRLPLPEADNPSADLLFEAAEEAEERADWKRAEDLYRRFVAIERSDPIAPFNLANVLGEQGRVGEAKCFLQLALAIDPAFAEAWYNLGCVAEKEGRPDLARSYLRRAIDADPFYSDPMYNLAHAYFKAGDYANAREWWRHYLDLDSDSAWGRKAQQGLKLCQAYLREAE
jgi:tetratricopeptide (TPR) repeat protein